MVRTGLCIAMAALALAGCNKKDEAGAPSAADAGKPAVASAEVVLTPDTMPRRKPGLWEHKITTAGATQVMTLCLDEAADRKLAVWGQGASQEMCQQTDMRRRLDGAIAFSSTCDMGGGGKTTSKGVIQGDFGTGYKMEADSVTEGASAPQMNGVHKMTLEAAWKGPCPAGARPGDVEMSGMKFNMIDMLAKK